MTAQEETRIAQEICRRDDEIKELKEQIKNCVGMYGETPRVKVGSLSICQQYIADDSKGIWIEDESGEGGDFKTEMVEKVLRKFFDDNF